MKENKKEAVDNTIKILDEVLSQYSSKEDIKELLDKVKRLKKNRIIE